MGELFPAPSGRRQLLAEVVSLSAEATSHFGDLVELAARAEEVAAAVELPEGIRFEAWRRRIRQGLVSDGVAADLDQAVTQLLANA